jgi:predicted nucleic acid-binding protein
VASGTAIVVPAVWFLEMANVLLVLQRRKRITREHRHDALKMLSALNPTVDEESSKAAFHTTSELAEKHGLTIYDATYVELAMRRKLHLASRDTALRNAAKRCGVKVF